MRKGRTRAGTGPPVNHSSLDVSTWPRGAKGIVCFPRFLFLLLFVFFLFASEENARKNAASLLFFSYTETNHYHVSDNRVLPAHLDRYLAYGKGLWYRSEYIINRVHINCAMREIKKNQLPPTAPLWLRLYWWRFKDHSCLDLCRELTDFSRPEDVASQKLVTARGADEHRLR